MWLFSLLQKYSPNHSTAVSITCWRERWQFSRWINEDLAMQLYLLNTQILDSNRTQIKLASATFNKYVKKNTKHICEISYIKNTFRSSHCGTVGSAAFWECWDTGSVPSPAWWVKDPAFARIWSLAQKLHMPQGGQEKEEKKSYYVFPAWAPQQWGKRTFPALGTDRRKSPPLW